MGHQETYTCQDCGFEFTEGDRNFFHDYNTNETVDYIHLFFNNWNLTILILIGLFPNHIAKYCDKFIKSFYIDYVNCPQHTPEEIVLNVMEKWLLQDLLLRINS